jgi:hypothetical protein
MGAAPRPRPAGRSGRRQQGRHDVAQLRGVQRHPLGHGLALYQAGGLDALRARDVPAGKRLSLPPNVLAALAQVRRQPAGFASFEALRRGLKQTPPRDGHDHTRSPIGRPMKATLKVPRPRHTKTP